MNEDNPDGISSKSPLADLGVHPKNHYKYCPRCGVEGTFNSSNYSFKCHSCGFQFFINSSAAVTAIIFNDKGELLLSRRGVEPEIGKLDLPGGFIDPGENAETAMMREIKEELDLVPDRLEYMGTFPNDYHFSGTVVFTIDLVFKCHVSDFSTLTYRDDIIGLEFIKPHQINLDEVPFKSVKNIIKTLVK